MSWLHSFGVFRVISLYWISLSGLETSWVCLALQMRVDYRQKTVLEKI